MTDLTTRRTGLLVNDSFKANPVSGISNVKVYPNPFTDQIQLQIGEAVIGELFTIEIFDFQGHLLLNSKNIIALTNESFTLEFPQQFANGMYILSCRSESINKIFKLIKA